MWNRKRKPGRAPGEDRWGKEVYVILQSGKVTYGHCLFSNNGCIHDWFIHSDPSFNGESHNCDNDLVVGWKALPKKPKGTWGNTKNDKGNK